MSSAPTSSTSWRASRPAAASTRCAARRPETRAQSQASYDALFAPIDDTEASVGRAAARRRVRHAARGRRGDRAALPGAAPTRRIRRCATRSLGEAAAASTTGPYGHYAETGLQAENTDGLRYRAADAVRERARRAAHGRHRARAPARLPPPRGLRRRHPGAPRRGMVDGRHRHAVPAHRLPVLPAAGRLRTPRPLRGDRSMTDIIQSAPVFRYDVPHPEAFTQARVGWVPWLEPKPVDELTDREYDGGDRPQSPEVRLLPPARARSRRSSRRAPAPTTTSSTTSPRGCRARSASSPPPPPRASTAASSARRCTRASSSHYSKREADVQRLLDEGVTARARRALGRDRGCRGRRHRARPSPSRRRTSRGCERPGSTTSRSRTSSTEPRSSTGPTASCCRSAALPHPSTDGRPGGRMCRPVSGCDAV